MSKISFQPAALKNITLVSVFEPKPNIELELGMELTKIAAQLNAQIQKLPDTGELPPEAPRIALVKPGFSFLISLDRITFNYNFESLVNTVSQTNTKTSFDESMALMDRINALMNANFLFFGIIGRVAANTSRVMAPPEIAKVLFSNFIKAPTSGEPVSAKLELGFLSDDKNHYVNFRFQAFETKTFPFPKNKTGPFQIDVAALPAEATGLEIVLDVNDRPMKSASDWRSRFSSLMKFFDSVASQTLKNPLKPF